MLAKERSAHRAKMLLSSRVFFDGSMQTLFRMDSRSITALAHAVCPHFSPARDTPDAVLPSIRLAVFLFLCAHGATLEMTADRFAIRSSTVSGIIREVAATICEKLRSLTVLPALTLCASHFAEQCGIPQITSCIDGTHTPVSRPAEHGDMCITIEKAGRA
ncbi:hypothetical protein JG687_00015040 [Phytophthora cactorum]|uniref:Uncharacterized protein n=1 Tax=Phytophthora cactorum TaxID=29920 RepID=A0A8T1TXA5_9STRA|nr:hypothetical protein JG687_00015040 [Phytophthora cactorum]